MDSEVIAFPHEDEPIVRRSGDDYVATWPLQYPYLSMRFRAPYEDKAGVHAELGVAIDLPGFPRRPEWGRLNLIAAQTRTQTANRLTEQWGGPGAPPFRMLLTDACAAVVSLIREGEPYDVITQERQVDKPYFTLNPLLPENKITTLFGDGGSGKGFLALAVCLSIQEDRDILGMPPTPGAVLYLDYETDNDEQTFRVRRLAEGCGLSCWRDIHYRRLFQPIYNEASSIRRYIDDHNIALVVVDSVGAAIGADLNDASEVIRVYSTMRSFRVTVLAIDHTSKGDSNGRPTGSNYKFHYSRAIWETKKAQETGTNELRVALLNHKANNNRLSLPLGFHFRFDGDEGPVSVERLDVRGDPALAAHASTPNRILFILKEQRLTFPGLLDELRVATPEIKENTVTQAIKRLAKANRVATGPDGKYGLASNR